MKFLSNISKLYLAGIILACIMLSITEVPLVNASEGVVLYDNASVESYHLTVLGRPNPIAVGKLSLLIRIARNSSSGTEEPVSGLRVLVQVNHISGPGADQASSYLQRRDLVASGGEPGTYEVSDSLQNEGIYRITLNINDSSKVIATNFEITALPQPDDRLISLAILTIAPLSLLLLLWLYLSKPGKNHQEETENRDVVSSTTQ